MLIQTAGQVVELTGSNAQRKNAQIQNRGPGTAFVQRWPFPGGTTNPPGIPRVPVNGIMSDLPPGPVHKGAWYVLVDVANTEVTFDEQI